MVAPWVNATLHALENGILVCESYLARASDRARDSTAREVIAGAHVYAVAVTGDPPKLIETAVRLAHPTPYGLGVLAEVSAEEKQRWLSGAEIEPSDLENIARGAQYLLFGAYDGESVLVWARGERRVNRVS